MLIRKHIALGQERTTLALEPPFWEAIALLAGNGGVNAWIEKQLAAKPETEGRASWVRQRVLGEMVKKARFA